MPKENNNHMFNMIAPIYGLFYKRQKKTFNKIIDTVQDKFAILKFESIIDVGCGTGALCSVLNDRGIQVTGIDPAINMLRIALNKNKDKNISFIQANVLGKLPFDSKSFDIAIASYVAHGLMSENRKKMYFEMSRIAKYWVIIHDYNDKKSPITTILERLERGDYFQFIQSAENEMKDCITEMKSCFSEVKVLNVDIRAAWYICKPNN